MAIPGPVKVEGSQRSRAQLTRVRGPASPHLLPRMASAPQL